MRVIRVGAFILAAVLWGTIATAQTSRECDTTPTSTTAVNTGQTFTLGWCLPPQNPVVTLWKVWRNGVLLPTPTVIAASAPNTAGLTYYSHTRSETSAGQVVFEVAAVNSVGDGPRVPFASLLVSVPGTVPAAIVRPRIAFP